MKIERQMKSIVPTFLWKDMGRRNLVTETLHDRHMQTDYDVLHDLGISVALDGIVAAC